MRSHYCGHVTHEIVGSDVLLSGWVHRRRDHGGVIFVDLRDREGLVQVVFNPEDEALFAIAESLRNEFVIQVKGLVHPRPEGTVNPDLPTGKIEVVATEVTILNRSEPLPFMLNEHQNVSEEVRLRHRFLDLRRPEMFERFKLRAAVVREMHQFLDGQGFIEVETPTLLKATPEGARDYLVPSRVHDGAFYALPQSPQILKQLLMMSGFDRYYQIARCYRDEDLRADRQPEFTQLDIETSFLNEQEIQDTMETMIKQIFKNVMDVDLPETFPRMTYLEAMTRFGSDKPDLRIDLELVDIADLLKDIEFKVFAGPANDPKGRVSVMRVPGGNNLTRKQIDDYTKFVSIYGAKGLAYIKVNDLEAGLEGLQSPILKFIPDDIVKALIERVGAQTGDLLFFGADKYKIVSEALGALRIKVGIDRGLVQDAWKPLWVTDFPMFEEDDAGNWQALHHPFTSPSVHDAAALEASPGACNSRAYDIVLNGSEIGGGSIRIHDMDMQQAIFRILGIGEAEAQEKFGFLLDALRFGCPPHGGIAFGLDRIIMMMTGASSIRDVIAFPKTQTASCPLTQAPSQVSAAQLRELGIKIREKETV